MKRILAGCLALVLTPGIVPVAAGQAQSAGQLAGRATNEARRPYTNYVVQLRDAETGQIALSTTLDTQGRYEFAAVPYDRHFLVELYDTSRRQMVCTEGPQVLTAEAPRRLDLNIDCGAAPAAAWLVAAAAGAVAAVGVATQSASE